MFYVMPMFIDASMFNQNIGRRVAQHCRTWFQCRTDKFAVFVLVYRVCNAKVSIM